MRQKGDNLDRDIDMVIKQFIFAVATLVVLQGCAGVKFYGVVPENQVLPPEIVNSVPASVYRHDLNSLTGQLAVLDDKGQLTPVLRAVDPVKLPVVTTIPEEQGLLYKSIISSEGNSILKAASSGVQLSAGQKGEMQIRQTSRSMISEVPRDLVLKEKRKISSAGGRKIFYITGAVISHVKTSLFDEIASDATVEYGPVFGINGKVYKSSSVVRNDYVITLSMIDTAVLDDEKVSSVESQNDLVVQLTAPAPTAPQPPKISNDEITPVPPQQVQVRAPATQAPNIPDTVSGDAVTVDVVK